MHGGSVSLGRIYRMINNNKNNNNFLRICEREVQFWACVKGRCRLFMATAHSLHTQRNWNPYVINTNIKCFVTCTYSFVTTIKKSFTCAVLIIVYINYVSCISVITSSSAPGEISMLPMHMNRNTTCLLSPVDLDLNCHSIILTKSRRKDFVKGRKSNF